MAQRLVKFSSTESGTFNTNTNPRFHIKVTSDNTKQYNMADSYLLLNVQPDGIGSITAGSGAPAGSLFSMQFGEVDAGFGTVYYTPSCMIRNCKMKTDKQGILEENRDRSVFTQSLNRLRLDPETLQSMEKYGYGYSRSQRGASGKLFVNQLGGTVQANNVMIPLSELFESGKLPALPYGKVGDIEFEFEMETNNNQQLMIDQVPLVGLLPQNTFACDNGLAATLNSVVLTGPFASLNLCPVQKGDTVLIQYQETVGGVNKRVIAQITNDDFTIALGHITVTLPANTLTAANRDHVTLTVLHGMNEFMVFDDFTAIATGDVVDFTTRLPMTVADCPLYVNAPINILYNNNAGAVRSTTARVAAIAQAAAPNADKLQITIKDVAAAINVIATESIRSIFVKSIPSQAVTVGTRLTSPRPQIQKAEIVMVEEMIDPKTSKDPIKFNIVKLETFNKPDVSTFQKVYFLDQGTKNIFVMNCQDRLLSNQSNFLSYRLYYDNKSSTSVPVLGTSALYKDRIMRTMSTEINNMILPPNFFLVADVVQVETAQPILQVNLNATANMGNSIQYLFKLIPVTI